MRRWLGLAAPVGALVAAVSTLAAPHAQEGPAFRGGTDVVSLYVTVTDDARHLVPNLTRGDFSVYDNGKLQPLTYFSNDLQPFSAVVMLDRSGSMASHFDLIRDAGITFVKQMIPGDRVRIGSFSDRIVISPAGFTSDQDTLIGLLRDRLQQMGSSPVWSAIDRSVTALLEEEQRRVVLVFSDGHNDPLPGQPITHLDDIERRTGIDDVMIYSIGFAASVGSSRFVPPRGPGQFPFPGPNGPFRPRPSTSTKRIVPPDPGLKALADQSGGGYFEMKAGDDLNGTFARVAEELHRQYWLGFTPAKLDGKSHKLEVRVRRPDVRVRTRKSYVATARQ